MQRRFDMIMLEPVFMGLCTEYRSETVHRLLPTVTSVTQRLDRIRQLRQERGWRQIDLAEETGMHENYVSDLEQGHKEICIRMLQTVANAFGLTLAELLKGIE
jgi:ribosome-binding protein aMBF1 (putative translation factor)